MTENLLNRSLPKWPQMLVTGTRLSEDLALEVIRRTDSWFVWGNGCNDYDGDHRLAQRFRMHHYRYCENGVPPEGWEAYEAYRAHWKEKWGALETDYVRNSWIGSSFIYGPHGWC